MGAYYNENDPKAAAWLRELIKADLIAPGGVDERSIEDVAPSDLRGYDQHHFFAGIGGWSYALRLAGWPDDKPVWTGSCPCQPFSAAGKRKGTADERHLWPAWHWLIKQYRPNCIFGEQVGSKDGIAWLDIVSTDLEGEGYTFAPIVFPACGVGAPHKRERLWFVADSDGGNARAEREQRGGKQRLKQKDRGTGRMANPASDGRIERWPESNWGGSVGDRGLGDSGSKRTGRNSGAILETQRESSVRPVGNGVLSASSIDWSDVEWIECRDGKARPIKPGIFPLAHGLSGRVGLLRGAGNAIVPQVAKEIIESYMEVRST